MSRRAVSRKTRTGTVADYQTVKMQIADSYIELEEKPGLGIEINEDVVKRYRLP